MTLVKVVAALVLLAAATACGSGGNNTVASAPTGEVIISCGGGTPVSLFDTPARKLDDSEPDRVAANDHALVGDELRNAAVWRSREVGDTRHYLAGEPPDLHVVQMERRDGKWRWQGGGGCLAFVEYPGRAAALWAVLEGGVDQATEFDVLAKDRQCASGNPADGRVGDAVVEETAESVLITFTASELSGGQTCPGHAAARRHVTLKAPLGTRTLLDGSIYPPQPPCRHGELPDSDDRAHCGGFYVAS